LAGQQAARLFPASSQKKPSRHIQNYIEGADVTVKNILRSIKNIWLQIDKSWNMNK